ncbi:hypothetical protein CEE45_03370 [Candidatus Heimdallarchaeota archaeon B3_Heim]|nr:MAG: hypothetical protein CEE45_03370 [Candidatus Heimdallarchaeota archaeon B3_Heim]
MSIIVEYLLQALFWGVIFNFPLLFIIIKIKLLTMPGGILTGATIAIMTYIISPFLWCALLAFFLTSSLISKQSTPQKQMIIAEFSKDSTRDAIQVLSNSLPALFFGIIFLSIDFFPFIENSGNFSFLSVSPLIYAAFASLATHNSDTWMTEIGISTSSIPRLITNLKKEVPKGTSGGVTLKGTSAGIVGSMIISFIYLLQLLLHSDISLIHMIVQFIFLTFAGTLGGLIDSFEGATIQGLYYCEHCQKVTERQIHRCGNKTNFFKGYRLVTNDLVNISSALFSGIIALIGFSIIEGIF